jgi:hypothetical protein
MLTPTDIHYLVGLLTRVTVPDDVEVELGELVYDIAAQKKRDIDITVKHKTKEGIITVFRGIEVKDHSKPLNVTHVEQLCQKFADIPDITHKAIVSASGYTKGAEKKAKYYSVELFHLIPWNDPSIGFNHVSFPKEGIPFSEDCHSWMDTPIMAINVNEKDKELLKDLDLLALPVCFADGSQIPNCSTVKELATKTALDSKHNYIKDHVLGKTDKTEFNIQVKLLIEPVEKVCINFNNKLIPITEFRIIGVISFSSLKKETVFKILIRHKESIPYVGCAIAEMTNGDLIAITINNENTNVKLFNIPLNSRLKNKIYKEKI